MSKNNLFCLALSLFAFALQAQDVKKDFKTSSISIFKNGSAFFIKSANVKTTDGVYKMTDNIPPALFGTYWVHAQNNQLEFLSSFVDTLKSVKKIPANNISQMLNANIGKKVKLHIGEDEIIDGLLEGVVPVEKTDDNTAKINGLITFKMDGSWLTFSSSEVRRIEFFDQPNNYFTFKDEEVKPVIQVDFKSKSSQQKLNMMYLSNGLNWTPMYLIELTGEKKAKLTLRAEVSNNIEDIENTDVNFVVGVPNFRFANRKSALVDLFGNSAWGRQTNQFANFSNGQATQTIGYGIEADAAPSGFTSNQGLEGSAQEDLYFYTLKNMSLKKGGRGHYPVFTADIDIEHIYECNLPQNTENGRQYQNDFLFSPTQNKVFHSIKVNNDTKYPFTTGPALVVKKVNDTKPISQDQLNYTSINGHSFVKLTESPDVRIKQAEKVINREDKVKKVTRNNSNYHYSLLTVEGQVKIKNYKSKDIDLNVRRTIYGMLDKSSIKWLKAEKVNMSYSPNQITDVCWETSVKAGEELVIKYSYKVYVLN